jgi:hypothetical protein
MLMLETVTAKVTTISSKGDCFSAESSLPLEHFVYEACLSKGEAISSNFRSTRCMCILILAPLVKICFSAPESTDHNRQPPSRSGLVIKLFSSPVAMDTHLLEPKRFLNSLTLGVCDYYNQGTKDS